MQVKEPSSLYPSGALDEKLSTTRPLGVHDVIKVPMCHRLQAPRGNDSSVVSQRVFQTKTSNEISTLRILDPPMEGFEPV